LSTQTFNFHEKGLIFKYKLKYVVGVIKECVYGQAEEDEPIEGHLFLPLYHLLYVILPPRQLSVRNTEIAVITTTSFSVSCDLVPLNPFSS